VLPRDFCESGAFGSSTGGGAGVSSSSSGEETSPRLETTESLPIVDCREGLEELAVGVGDAGILRGPWDGLSDIGREASVGDGKFWMTFSSSLLVRIAAV
jgi:hypothetical protein